MLPKKASKADMIGAIQKHVGKFKKDELAESGLVEHLESIQDDQVTSQDVADYLDANKIQMKEVVRQRSWKIRRTNGDDEQFDTLEEATAAMDGEHEWIENEAAWMSRDNEEIITYDYENNEIFKAEFDKELGWFAKKRQRTAGLLRQRKRSDC